MGSGRCFLKGGILMDKIDDKSLVIAAVTILGGMTIAFVPELAQEIILACVSGLCGMAIGKLK